MGALGGGIVMHEIKVNAECSSSAPCTPSEYIYIVDNSLDVPTRGFL